MGRGFAQTFLQRWYPKIATIKKQEVYRCEELEPLYTIAGKLLYEKTWWFLRNLEGELPYDLAIPLLGIYSKK